MRLLIAALLCAALPALADPEPKIAPAGNMTPIALPGDGDDYSRLVALAAARDPTTDFRALRLPGWTARRASVTASARLRICAGT
ncbi:MAG: hypothetical protein JWP16_1633 [Alphaproteobacteria bacterium]|nr:hypothetical protein [Alphaproteobacteria bacterium]MDB5740593.1 hypothetical protein [Alphaproteobacteria bacterium]